MVRFGSTCVSSLCVSWVVVVVAPAARRAGFLHAEVVQMPKKMAEMFCVMSELAQ